MNPSNSDATYPKSAPPLPLHERKFQGQWSTGLFDCLDDPSNCCITWCCPCITMGRIVEIIDQGSISCRLGGLIYCGMSSIGCGWLYASTYRSKLRSLFSLPEAPSIDWLVHCCCCLCSICQEYRELKNRGANPSLGWQGNVEKWDKGGVKPPFVESRMSR